MAYEQLADSSAMLVMVLVLVALLALALVRPLWWTTGLLLYGRRSGSYEAIRALGVRLSDGRTRSDVPRVICDTVARLVPSVRLDLVVQGQMRVLAEQSSTESTENFELRHHDQVIGRLAVGPADRLDALDRRVLAEFADRIGPAVAGLRLAEELRLSRLRLISAGEDERRRLRRDLHDGVAPGLAGLRLQLETVLAGGDRSGRLVAEANHMAADTLAELRRVIDGLRPAALDELGLTGSLARLADRLSTVTTAVKFDCPCPDEVVAVPAAHEVAAYWIASEAMTNAVRHAEASQVAVLLRREDENLVVRVTDNGRGFERARPGVGLNSMRERAEHLRGTCVVDPTPAGTTVHARIPLEVA